MKVDLETSSVRMFVGEDMPDPDSIKVAAGQAVVFTAACPGAGRPNEDACVVTDYGEAAGALVVSDGAGGGRQGAEAARRTVEEICVALQEGLDAGRPIRNAVLNGIERANDAVRELGTGAAATVSVVEIDGNCARTYHVGDSMILLVGGRGKIKHQSVAHGPVGYAMEAGLLSESEAMRHEERHLISNFIGDAEMRIEIGPRFQLAPRDTILLASDGLYDNLYIEEIVRRIRKGPLDGAARDLASLCRRRMEDSSTAKPSKADDLTLVLFRPGTLPG